MRRLGLVLLAACGFHGPSTAATSGDDAAPGGEGAIPVDAVDGVDALPDAVAIDAPPPCTIRTQGTPQAGTALGNPARGAAVTSATELPQCPSPDERIIGVRLVASSVVPLGWTEEAVVGTSVRCGKLARIAGAMTTTPTALVGFVRGPCGNWGANLTGAEVDCPAGQVLIGFTANEDTDSQDNSMHDLFNSVAIECAPLDAQGRADNAQTVTIPVPGTFAHGDRAQAAGCSAGQSVTSLRATTGCGVDSLTVVCAQTACQ